MYEKCFSIVRARTQCSGGNTSTFGWPILRRRRSRRLRCARRRGLFGLEGRANSRIITTGVGWHFVANCCCGVAVRTRVGARRERVGLLVVHPGLDRPVQENGLQVLPSAGALQHPAAGALRSWAQDCFELSSDKFRSFEHFIKSHFLFRAVDARFHPKTTEACRVLQTRLSSAHNQFYF